MAGARRESSRRREVPRDSAQEPIRLFCCSAKNWRNVSFLRTDKTLSIDCVVSKITFSFLVCLCGKKNPNNVDRFRWGSSSCSHASWRITRWSGWPQIVCGSCVVFNFLFLKVSSHFNSCDKFKQGSVNMLQCWFCRMVNYFHLHFLSKACVNESSFNTWLAWMTFTCYFKARVNESNALLGWMIYYFVFWLLPMQVNIESIWPLSWFSRTWLKWYKVKSNLTLNWIISNLT